ETVKQAGGNPLLFGEWAAAERFPVFRGEYVGQSARVEVPVWQYRREEVVIASDSTTAGKRRPGISVYFGFAPDERSPDEAVLVDFDNGQHGYERVVSRTDDAVKTEKVTDHSGTEALILKPDGRLMLVEGANDFTDENRTKQL